MKQLLRNKTLILSVSGIVLAAALCVLAVRGIPETPFSVSHQDEATEGQCPLVAVDATPYRGLMQMLGVGDRCIDFSSQMKPDVEKIVASGAQMFMVSAYDGVDLSKYRRMNMRLVECRDFMETTPLGRAAWMKKFGRLWGVGKRADSLYQVVETRYRELSRRVKKTAARPAVFFDTMYGNMWYQPSRISTAGGMVEDAGGRLPFDISINGGSLAMSKEQVLSAAKDAEVWIIRYQGDQPMTLKQLASLSPVYSQFRAFREGNVWGVNTSKVAYFDEAPFRPDYLLEDMVNILHPEMKLSSRMHYYSRLK